MSGNVTAPPSRLELRRGVLAVSVLHDLDIAPLDDGVLLTGPPMVHVAWRECRRALAGSDPETAPGRERLGRWLLARRWAADLPLPQLLEQLRPVGLPVRHVLHPGLDWVQRRVLGGALDLGFGAVGIDPTDPDRVVLLPQPLLDSLEPAAEPSWPTAERYLDRVGALAAERLERDAGGRLRPIGDCDVVTLLGSAALRTEIAAQAGGLGAVVAPMRRRGWTRLSLMDPAFGPAAAAATAAEDRGFDRPLLVTPDELTLVAPGGRPAQLALRDPAADAPWLRDVRYR